MVQKSCKRLHTFTGYTKPYDTILVQVSYGNVRKNFIFNKNTRYIKERNNNDTGRIERGI